MRLINTASHDLTEFHGAKIPEYGILSHTWKPDGEVTLQQFVEATADARSPIRLWQGYGKILEACKLARQHQLEWIWIDTACIDKTSSADLSEAINSMFRWYRDSKVCYAYLADLEPGWAEPDPALSRCRWFTRGWCLQELLAPSRLQLLANDWSLIGKRRH
ncbi:heterokaryon incompatibility protein-domain-containing protein [Lasiosphaeria ovina]|uniref:Heterokaryon incompatibility protein-domain-containing protein n=1 Tax=Lasiosphaeria ovina TaxID=92902 RepID=A0AAE0NM53_9PEZI|nr:heterokaryon incompatibility protein-domain-containing protein [Lasiosphaeria ovina]